MRALHHPTKVSHLLPRLLSPAPAQVSYAIKQTATLAVAERQQASKGTRKRARKEGAGANGASPASPAGAAEEGEAPDVILAKTSPVVTAKVGEMKCCLQGWEIRTWQVSRGAHLRPLLSLTGSCKRAPAPTLILLCGSAVCVLHVPRRG
jgi:hypothetical protein